MQSGRVASIDLTGHPDAVEGARDLLRMNGATRIDESAEKACNRCGAMLSNDGGMAWFHPNGLIMCGPVQAYAGDEYDGDRALRARQRSEARAQLALMTSAQLIQDEDAPGAGGNQPEGTKTNLKGKI